MRQILSQNTPVSSNDVNSTNNILLTKQCTFLNNFIYQLKRKEKYQQKH